MLEFSSHRLDFCHSLEYGVRRSRSKGSFPKQQLVIKSTPTKATHEIPWKFNKWEWVSWNDKNGQKFIVFTWKCASIPDLSNNQDLNSPLSTLNFDMALVEVVTEIKWNMPIVINNTDQHLHYRIIRDACPPKSCSIWYWKKADM